MSDRSFLEKWHEVVFNRDYSLLSSMLHEDVAFHSPFVWKPKLGKKATIMILSTVTMVFQDFTYQREIHQGQNWVLEFSARVGDFDLKGVDLISLNDDGLIVDFEVMVRPANALMELGTEMNKRLAFNS